MKFIFAIIFFFNLVVLGDELVRPNYFKNVQKSADVKTDATTTVYTKYDPFFDACKKTDSNQKIIPVEAISPIKSIFPEIIHSDQKGHTAFDLINETYKYTQTILKQNLLNTKKSLACVDEIFDKKAADIKTECYDTFQDVANSAVASQRARYELAIAMPSSKVLNDTQYRTLNTDLNIPINTFKVTPWNPLTQREKDILNESWDSFLIESEKEAKEKAPANFSYTGPPVSHQFTLDLIQKKRKSAMLNYHLQMTKYPLIQFIQNDDPGKADFKKAYEAVIQNIEKEIENIKTKQNKLILNPKQQITSDDLFILNYMTAENMLLSNPKYCSVAQSLIEYQKKKQMYFSGGTMAVMLGVGISGKVPAAAVFTAGSLLSGLSTYEAYVKYKESMQAHLAAPVYEDQIFRKNKVDSDKQNLVLNATLAVAFGVPQPVRLTDYISGAKTIAESQLGQYFKKKALIYKIKTTL